MNTPVNKPVVWTIAGSDSSGGAGIQADLRVFEYFGLHGASVTTALTAQNSKQIHAIHFSSPEFINAQLAVLQEELPAKAVKIGLLGQSDTIQNLKAFLKAYTGYAVLDPVLFSTSGKKLCQQEEKKYAQQLTQLLPYVNVATPNILEAEIILGMSIKTHTEMEKAAHAFLALGCKNVIIKGGHLYHDTMCQDYWTNGSQSYWLANNRYQNRNYRGTGCTFSSAMTGALALGYEIRDAIVIAKMYVNRGIRLSSAFNSNSAFIHHAGWPEDEIDLPVLSNQAFGKTLPTFPDCGMKSLGLYPVVDSSEWVQTLLSLGVKTIQLRIKNKSRQVLESEIQKSIQYAKKFEARLFINDYWELAIAHGAYGVHLGQEDLETANINRIREAGLRLGISTHCYYEVARAHTFKPSYLACGPIFPTTSKIMPFTPQGLTNLQRWHKTLSSYSLVAIGGINTTNIQPVLATKVSGVAMISAITQSDDPIQQTKTLLQYVENDQCH